jgi:hypothetical protein
MELKMSDNIQSTLDDLTAIFTATDEVLSGWTGEGNLQFPTLIGMMAVKLNWDEKQAREADPLIRFYVRKHPDWYVTRGAHGGIMRLADKQKKEAAKTAKAAIKDQLKAQIEAKVASTTETSTTTV